MSILKISNELSGAISTFSENVNSFQQKDVDGLVKDNAPTIPHILFQSLFHIFDNIIKFFITHTCIKRNSELALLLLPAA